MTDVENLRATLAELADEDVAEVIAEARAGARVRARELIEDALVEEIMRAAERGRSPTRGPTPKPQGEAFWAYCVLSSADAGAVGELEGVEPGSSVECVVEGDLAALVSRVPLADYDDEQLREHLNDIEWVERTARAHEAVLEQALDDCTIVPLRLCTLFRGLERVRDFLRDEHHGLTAGLAALTGRAEWGLKLFVDEERLRDSLTGPDATATEAGAGYLDRKQRERDERQARADLIAYFAKEAHEHVATIADAARANPVQRPEAHGREAEMVLNGVYLVRRERERELIAAVEELRTQVGDGLELELTGPWPAYNFVAGTESVTS